MKEAAYGLSSSTTICVRLFGSLEVFERGPGGGWQAVKKSAWTLGTPPRSVLKRLLTTPGRRLTRCDIEDDLWPDAEMELAAQNLSNALMVIRRIIGKDLLETSGPLCAIADQSQVWTDLDACRTLLKEAENQGCTTFEALSLLEEALSYFERGKCLEDESERWCHAVRADAERMQRQCRLWLAEGYERAGKLWQAGEQYRAMTSVVPPDEEALQKWINMLVRHGKIQDALRCQQDTVTFWNTQECTTPPTIMALADTLREQAVSAFHSPALSLQGIINGTENDAEEAGSMDHLRRQISFQGAKAALGLVALPSVPGDLLGKRLLIALTRQPSPMTETLDYLQQRVEHYWEQRQTARLGPALAPYVTEDLQRVLTLLEGSLLPDIRIELTVIAGNLAMLLGELSFELNLYPSAREYYKMAAIAAHEANNPSLEAVVYGRRSLTWIYQNQLKAALTCIQRGHSLASSDSPIVIWLSAIEAEIQSKMGNQQACLISLQNAAQLRELPAQKPFYWIHFDVSLLAGYEGICFLRLGKSREAQHALTQALESLDATTYRRKPRLLIDLARAYVHQGEGEIACTTSLEAAHLLCSIKSPLTYKRLLSLRKELSPWQETASGQELDEALSQLAETR